jgi:D-beta-D-heptose 7-phosphate kinase/D-beta-D-heptose 1-phosphate adenosyltransferase
MQLLSSFSKTRILVIGDVMLDRYWWGNVGRISPEAPVPVVRLENTTLAAGGAANVAVNIAGLGAEPILVGVVGSDGEARLLNDVLATAGVASGHLLSVASRPTTVKTRVIAHSQQVARIDQELDSDLDDSSQTELIEKLASLIDSVNAIVVSDYAKGLLTDKILLALIESARSANKKILVDPKGKDYGKYRGATMITPNKREAADACNLAEYHANIVDSAGPTLLNDLGLEAVLITQGELGMTLFSRGAQTTHFPALARTVYDVTGAGDTVIATLATALGAGADLETGTNLANIAAGLVVEQIGTTSIMLSDLERAVGEEREGTANA